MLLRNSFMVYRMKDKLIEVSKLLLQIFENEIFTNF